MDVTTLVGLAAAFLTTASNVPQLKKCWDTGSAGDLSFKMLAILSGGVVLWLLYGFLKDDWVIILANVVTLLLVAGLLWFKVREHRHPAQGAA